VTRVGTLVLYCLGFLNVQCFLGLRVFVIVCWPDMVPNQRQLFIVVSDWGSYLGSHFPFGVCGILFYL
jgi:hypothetical protein